MSLNNDAVQKLTKATGLDEAAIRLLVSTIESESRARGRSRLSVAVGVLALVVGTSVVAGVPSQLARFLVRAGPPGTTEAAPRQIAYSGTLEQQGVAVTNPSMPMRFTLFGQDAGVLHQETTTAAVSNGRFRVELGDTVTIPAAVFSSPFVELEVSVGSPLQPLGRQRILSVPYSLHSDDVLLGSRTITVGAGGDFPSLQTAWAWLQTKVVLGPVTVRILDGLYSLPAGGLALNHPNGSLISVVGNTTTPANVVFNAVDRGFAVTEGHRLALLDGLRLSQPGTNPTTFGIEVLDASLATLGPNLSVNGFENGVYGERNSTINIRGVDVVGRGPAFGTCIGFDTSTHVDIITFSANNCSIGVYASKGSTAFIRAGSVFGAGYAVYAVGGTTVHTGNLSVSGIGTPAFYAAGLSYLFTSTPGSTYLPAMNGQIGASGNLNSAIAN